MRAALYDLTTVVAQRHWDGHMDMDGGWWIVMMVGMVLFWGLVVVGIVWLVHSLQGAPGLRARREPAPLEVLDRRLAEGAVSVEEYEQRRKVLLGASGEGGKG